MLTSMYTGTHAHALTPNPTPTNKRYKDGGGGGESCLKLLKWGLPGIRKSLSWITYTAHGGSPL